MVGIRWKDWNTMPTWRPRNRASASSEKPVSSCPATVTVPESARSSPASTINRLDLPEPDGPTRPTASPRPIFSDTPLRIWTRAAPLPRESSTLSRRMAGSELLEEFACMAFAWFALFSRATFGSAPYGAAHPSRKGRGHARLTLGTLLAVALVWGATSARAEPIRLVAFGDSLTAGLGLPANQAFAGEAGSRAQGPRTRCFD